MNCQICRWRICAGEARYEETKEMDKLFQGNPSSLGLWNGCVFIDI